MQKETQEIEEINKQTNQQNQAYLKIRDQIAEQNKYNLLDYEEQFNSISFKQDTLIDLVGSTGGSKQQMGMGEYLQFIKDRIIEIEGPQLVSDGLLTSYKLYTIKSRKKNEKLADTCVTRRFSDFQYLQKQLIDKKGGCIIPLLPQKNLWASINWEGDSFAKNRLKRLLKYTQSLLDHQKLKITTEVKNFLFFDDIKFSQAKGEFVEQIKTQDKVKNIAYNAYNYGYGIVEKLWNSSNQKVNEVKLQNPTKGDLLLSEYQILINQFIRITGSLRKLVQCSVKEMDIIENIKKQIVGKNQQQQKQSNNKINILDEFQDVCEYIQSCCSAIYRRKQLRLYLEILRKQQKVILNKVKNNPRSQQIDLIRAKLKNVSVKCQNYTNQLLQELSKSIHLGRSMIQKFIQQYSNLKGDFYIGE